VVAAEAAINPAVAATAEGVAERVFFPMHCRQFLPNWPGPIQRGPGRFLFGGVALHRGDVVGAHTGFYGASSEVSQEREEAGPSFCANFL